MSNLHEECGVFGVLRIKNRAYTDCLLRAFRASAQRSGKRRNGGNDDGIFRSYKELGLVNNVFGAGGTEKISVTNMAVGHVRYGNNRYDGRLNAQPIVVNHTKGRMALAHNGNLTNSYELRRELELEGSIFHTHPGYRGNILHYYKRAP